MTTEVSAVMRGGRIALVLRLLVVSYIGLLVVLPLAAVVVKSFDGGLTAFTAAISGSTARDALALTLTAALVMSIINALMGTATAWMLVRYRFWGRAFASTIVDLPLAIPTLVTGMMIVVLLGPQSVLGGWLAGHGVEVVFAPPAIVLALLFINLPMVVRAVEPVLSELDPAEEEAARTLGASDPRIFFRILLPPLVPAIATGTLQSFARALAEFGSIVVVSGNIPHRTLTGAVFVFGEVESGEPQVAAAFSSVLLLLSLLLLVCVRLMERRFGVHRV